jgi:hypothetical protein
MAGTGGSLLDSDDFRLETTFENGITRHTYRQLSSLAGVRGQIVHDIWRHRRNLGRGGSGTVTLQACEFGPQRGSLRAVKELHKDLRSQGDTFHMFRRELEIMAKYSNNKVRPHRVRKVVTVHAR